MRGNIYPKIVCLKIKGVSEKYSEVFDSEPGKMKHVLVKIPVPSVTKPIFFKARPVPYALVEESIYVPLEY